MKHLAKDVWLLHDGEYNFELARKGFVQGGKKKGEEKFDTIGYFSNMRRVWNRIEDLAYQEYINGDVRECKRFIEEASKNVLEFVKGQE